MRERIWTIGDRIFDVSRHGLIMGVLNITPDSFSDGGEFFTSDKAIEQGLRMAAEGADIIDVGGESTRPGSEPVDAGEELRRVIAVIENLRTKIDVPISIDTSKAAVARAAIEVGASIVNDVTGGRGDERMLPVVAETKSIFQHDEVTDDLLVDRVRSRLGRIPAHIGAFDIAAKEGVVTLRGQILADELPKVLRAARFVRGVKGIDNQFEVHERAGTVPALPGQPQPLGTR